MEKKFIGYNWGRSSDEYCRWKRYACSECGSESRRETPKRERLLRIREQERQDKKLTIKAAA
ncbi:MAG: hypothetical protein QW331_03955 [Candidatus Woesearchaeota archaeon]